MKLLNAPFEFEWDGHNKTHIARHSIREGECEQVFFNVPLTVQPDVEHSQGEERYFALGKTNAGRVLLVVFTLRNKKIRIVTARDANRKERRNL